MLGFSENVYLEGGRGQGRDVEHRGPLPLGVLWLNHKRKVGFPKKKYSKSCFLTYGGPTLKC